MELIVTLTRRNDMVYIILYSLITCGIGEFLKSIKFLNRFSKSFFSELSAINRIIKC